MNTTLITIKELVSEAKCYETIRPLRWSGKVSCPHYESERIIKRGRHENQPERYRYECKACNKHFDDLTNMVLAGHHQPLST